MESSDIAQKLTFWLGFRVGGYSFFKLGLALFHQFKAEGQIVHPVLQRGESFLEKRIVFVLFL